MPKRKQSSSSESKSKRPQKQKLVTFPEALRLAVQNLQSADFKSREDAQDTLKSLHHVIELNERGFLTIDSQEGVTDASRERAYVSGFMFRDQAQRVMQDVMVNSDKIFFIQPIDTTNNMSAPQYFRPERIPLTVEGDKPAFTTQSLTVPKKIFDWQLKLVHVKPSKKQDIVMVFAFDPVWGRLAHSPDGLWATLLAAV
jgi:hypothetical protein